ncbi:MAG TPA: aminotransferase class I/II-fold pyridoxal phosphate-dependent enzyme [Anaerohalosphaeraceae bacterium]|nr:aminotransferase class I/II-fold pyridoxal phosphate-dependent enzyme [Anaerohalosphaeraceae bacterium]HOL89029.1 aminotransferase class I/II-fold pyridoxal phosphate-dependent enzyme [Anaerohalosphaeraceae bacterium]HPP56937.1 aminotransferase class I/II-fold pyridoxal phosphate-dependent enzyme [Anaerohalosphaeraceae bacterium]
MRKTAKGKERRGGRGLSMSARAVHAGEPRKRYADSITTPIVQTSTFVFADSREIERYTRGGKQRYEYGRYGNPTATIAERRLADLEGAEDCVVFSSGMSAITTTILSLVQSGDHIVITDDSYKKTLEFCRSYLKQFGIGCTIVPFGDYAGLEKAIRKNTRFIFSESPTNPYLNIFDLVKLKGIARRHGVLTLIDSTFATPLNQRPLEFGIDLVLHSCTKYLAGHNDILAGAVLGRTELVSRIRDLHKSMGGTIDPHCCYLLLRGMKTFPLRVAKQNETALKVARYLEGHRKIRRVYYPFLESHPHYAVAKSQMSGGGGVVTFETKGTLRAAKRFLDALRLCYIGPSLGGVETLITHPALVSYYDYSRKERYELGITDTLFRLAVGIEDAEDIIADLERGLRKL